MTTQVDVFVGPAHDLQHTSKVLTGFCALAGNGEISLRYRVPRGGEAWLAADPMVVVFDVHTSTAMRVAIDLRDGEGISRPIIDRVQLYLKRAYSQSECERLGELGVKIRPFGLNYPCRSGASAARMLLAVGGPIALTGIAGLRRIRHYLSTPGPAAFEQSPETPVDPAVVFQTRLWTESEVAAGEAEPLNTERLAMVRALKREFGPRFVGGLVPTPFAAKNYPEDLTPHSSKVADYVRLKKRCLISIYTRGVEHSLAFKLGETFAASQCLVSVPLHFQAAAPIEAGRHYLEFGAIDECIAACHRLLADASLSAAMRHANHDYYQREIEPAAHIRRVLERITQGAA